MQWAVLTSGAGAGCYVDGEVGGCAGTGDGDVMMRFLPSFAAVLLMRQGGCVLISLQCHYSTGSGDSCHRQ